MQLDIVVRDLETSVKEKEVRDHSFSEKIRELEWKVKHLTQTKMETIAEPSTNVNQAHLSLTKQSAALLTGTTASIREDTGETGKMLRIVPRMKPTGQTQYLLLLQRTF